MKLAWLTDPHLNCAKEPAWAELARQLGQQRPDALLLTGDIAEAPSVSRALEWLAQAAGCPVYFVLGNHDFYRGSIPAVRAAVRAQATGHARLRYLTGMPAPVTLCPGVALVGHDGWGDARAGDAARSPVMLADFYAIDELRGQDQAGLHAKLKALGDEAAQALAPALEAAAATHARVIVLTHVPPYVGAAWHEGQPSNDDWSPFFVCEAVGALLKRVAAAHPGCQISVLCGHTHGAGELWAASNLCVKTGGAEYGAPALQAPLWIG